MTRSDHLVRSLFLLPRHAPCVVTLALAAVCVGSAVAQPAPTTAPAPKVSDPLPPPNQRPDRPLPQLPVVKGEIRHGVQSAPPKPAGAIRIATYNLENFFDAPERTDRAPDPSADQPPADAKPESSRKAIAAALHAVNADILAFEEVESKETITRFRDEYLADMGYNFIASIDAGDPRGIEQSVLSRFPITSQQVWLNYDLAAPHPEKLGKRDNPDAGKPMAIKRSPFEACVSIPATVPGAAPTPLTLFVLHHKSGAYYSYLREAEGRGVRQIAAAWDKEHPGANIIILGDFNARPIEKSFKDYVDAGYADTFGDVVMAAPGTTTAKFEKEDPKYITHASNRAIDHILLSPGAAKAFEVKTRFVLGTLQRPENVDWRTTAPPEGYASDHYPVVVDLVPKPY